MDRLTDIHRRLLPDTLRARLVLAVLMTIIVVLVGTAMLLTVVSDTYVRQSAEQRAQDRLADLDAYLELRTDRLAVWAIHYSEWSDFYEYSAANKRPGDEWIANEIGEWLPLRSTTDVALWTSANGRTLWSMGSTDDVAVLQRIVDLHRDGPAKGRVRLSGGPAIFASLPITGYPPEDPAGRIVLASLVDEQMSAGFVALGSASFLTVGPFSGTATASAAPARTPSFSSVRSYVERGTLHISADITGWDGQPAGTITLADPDHAPLRPLYIPLLTAFGAVGLAAAASLLLGLVTTRFVRRPVDDLVHYVTEAVTETVEGAPHEPLPIAPEVPAELRVMLEAVDSLSERLAARQGELIEAVLKAQEAEERLRIAVDDSPEAKLLFVDGVVRLANPAAGAQMGAPVDRLLGLSMDEAMGGHSLPLAESDERLTPSEIVRRAIDGPVTVIADMGGRGPRWLEVTAVAHRGPGGEILVTSRDVTEERRRDEVRGEILGMVSHDLRSPLAVISGYLEILGRGEQDEVSGKALAGARKGVDSMLELLEDLLTTTRAEELFAPQTMAPVRLDALVSEVAETARATARQEIVVETEGEVATRGEERRLRQAVQNLIGNAVKYSPEGSRISVRVGSANGRSTVAVEDEGVGIPAEDRERIFERFSRIERREGKEKPGFGLGLYIVRAIVTGHGGSVRVEDPASGRGSRFVIDLPLA